MLTLYLYWRGLTYLCQGILRPLRQIKLSSTLLLFINAAFRNLGGNLILIFMKLKSLFFIVLMFSLFSCSSDDKEELPSPSGSLSFDGVQHELNTHPLETYIQFKDHVRVQIATITLNGTALILIFDTVSEGNVNDNLITADYFWLSFCDLISGNITYKKDGKKHIFTFENVLLETKPYPGLPTGLPSNQVKVNGIVELFEI